MKIEDEAAVSCPLTASVRYFPYRFSHQFASVNLHRFTISSPHVPLDC